MRLVAALMVALISLGGYMYFLKRAAPMPGTLATQEISTTGVEMDLNAIAQAERVYFAQNGSYVGLGELMSNGAMNIARTERDGYSYTVETSGGGFTVVARHPEMTAAEANGAVPIHYPTFSIDQNMQIRRD